MSRSSYVCYSPPDWRCADLFYAIGGLLTRKNPLLDLESKIGGFLNQENVMTTNLGRTALSLGLKAMQLADGDRIAIPAVVCSTVIRSILNVGLTPLLVDVESNLHISLKTILQSDHKKIAAVVVPHLYGLHAPIFEIRKWTRSRGIPVIDDAAQGFGICVGGKYLGTFGDIGILSFGPFKSLSTPRGGALVSRRRSITEAAMQLRCKQEATDQAIRRILGGLLKFHWRQYYLLIKEAFSRQHARRVSSDGSIDLSPDTYGYFQLSNLEARLISSTLERIVQIVTERRKTALKLCKVIRQFGFLEVLGPDDAPYIKVPISSRRDLPAQEIVNYLRSQRIEAETIYRPLHLYKPYEKFACGCLPQAEESWNRVFLIPNPTRNEPEALCRLSRALESLSNRI